LTPGHFQKLHPDYAKFRGRWWKGLGLSFIVIFVIPYGVSVALPFRYSVWLSILPLYVFAIPAFYVISRLRVEKRPRNLWKNEHTVTAPADS